MAKAKKKKKPTKAVPALPVHEQGLTEPGKLKFDKENPRFADQTLRTDDELILALYEQADVKELIQSILSSGYLDYEPLIVRKSDKVVLEGNRRLAALRIISDPALRRRLNIDLPEIADPKPLPSTIRVIYVDDRDEARSYIGFKHINGAFKWDALAKAKYAAMWFEKGEIEIDVIARSLGDNHNTVRRLVNGWFALQQAQNIGFDIKDISSKRFSFSHLYTALTRPSIREFVGLAEDDGSAAPKKNPVPKAKREEFETLMGWLYGQESRDLPTIIKNQNPNLNQLSRVLGNPIARRMLMATRDLKTAYARVDLPSMRFEEALLVASKHCEEALSLSGAFSGESTLLKVAEQMFGTVRSLVGGMKEATEKKPGEKT